MGEANIYCWHKTQHRHGTDVCWSTDFCRCDECTRAHAPPMKKAIQGLKVEKVIMDEVVALRFSEEIDSDGKPWGPRLPDNLIPELRAGLVDALRLAKERDARRLPQRF